MTNIEFECTYCGSKWKDTSYNLDYTRKMEHECGKCGDRNIVIRPIADGTGDAFGYRFDPKD